MRLPLATLALALVAAQGCASIPLLGRGGPTYTGFTAPWDPRSAASVRAHGAQLDAVVSGWAALDSATGMPTTPYPDSGAAGGGAARALLLTAYQGDRFHPDLIRRLAADSALRGRSAGALRALAARGAYRRLVLDFEGLSAADVDGLVLVARAYADSARAAGVERVSIAVPAGDTAGYPARALVTATDEVLVMLYDEHWSASAPGPIASPEWVARTLAVRLQEVGAERVVAGLPLYGYLWRPAPTTPAVTSAAPGATPGAAPSATPGAAPRQVAPVPMNASGAIAASAAAAPSPAPPALPTWSGEVVGFADASAYATRAGHPLERDPATGTLHAQGEGGAWEIWVGDAELLQALVTQASGAGVRRFALWRLGLEDPAVWGTVVR